MRTTIGRLVLAPLALAVLAACGNDDSRLPTQSHGGISAQAFAADRTPWSAPVPLPFPVNSPTANEQGPALSPDGLALYFCSDRAGGMGGNDLHASRRPSENDPWGDPVNLGAINSPLGDCGPTFSQDGLVLFFNSRRTGGLGPNDLYMASRTDPSDDLSWSAPVRLGPEINTAGAEAAPFVTRWYDDNTAELYFDRDGDTFVVTIDALGMAMGPATAVTEVNSSASDLMPTVRFDGREILLASNRAGGYDLFVATRQSRNHPWSEPVLVDELSVSGVHEIHPELSRDGRTVFFVTGQGAANDIWMATRTPSGN